MQGGSFILKAWLIEIKRDISEQSLEAIMLFQEGLSMDITSLSVLRFVRFRSEF